MRDLDRRCLLLIACSLALILPRARAAEDAELTEADAARLLLNMQAKARVAAMSDEEVNRPPEVRIERYEPDIAPRLGAIRPHAEPS